jgi:hypothetical protein
MACDTMFQDTNHNSEFLDLRDLPHSVILCQPFVFPAKATMKNAQIPPVQWTEIESLQAST